MLIQESVKVIGSYAFADSVDLATMNLCHNYIRENIIDIFAKGIKKGGENATKNS